LLEDSASQQLTILKSISLQFGASSLRIVVVMRANSQDENFARAVRNAIHDLDMNNVTFLIEPKQPAGSKDAPRVVLSSPHGKVRAAWDGFAGPTEIGFAVRKQLGTPVYAQMETSNNE
jgi:hypothetical protein